MFKFIEQEKGNHNASRICGLFGVSKSGYYAWRNRRASTRAGQDKVLLMYIKAIHRASRGTYGAPRIQAELRLGHGICCSRKRVARLMREARLQGISRRRVKGVTRRNPKRPSFPDQVERHFTAQEPNCLWVADITQHKTDEGWLYLAVILDVYSRKVIGWSMANHLRAELVIDALDMAIKNRQPVQNLIHHSDHGSQYTSLAFGKHLEQADILGSMGSVGDALDNAVAESFFATLQTELLDRQSWQTRQQLKTAIFEFIEVFYNRQRRHSTLQYLSPLEFERRYALQAAA